MPQLRTNAAPRKRQPNPPAPTRHASVFPQLAEQIAEQGHTVCIDKTDSGDPLTWLLAHAMKQQFIRYRGDLKRAVAQGDAKWEPALAHADRVCIRIERITEELAAISFYDRERTSVAKTLAAALQSGE